MEKKIHPSFRKKKVRKQRKNINKELLSPKIKTLVEKFTNITNSLAIQNEFSTFKKKENSVNEVSMEKDPSYSELNLHLTSNIRLSINHL